MDHLDAYQDFTEASLLVDVGRWHRSADPQLQTLGERWRALLCQQVPWKMVCQRNLVFGEQDSEHASIFSEPDLVEQRVRKLLGSELREIPLRVDIPRHMYRPHTKGPAKNQNYLFDAARDRIRPLSDNQLFRHLPISHRICRIYAQDFQHAPAIAEALDSLLGPTGEDDLTNM